MLSDEEVAARIKAGRTLRGLSQDELADRVAAEGLPWRLVGALERGEVRLRPAYKAALVEVLRLPEIWFSDPEESLWRDGPRDEARVIILEKLDTIIKRLEQP